MKRELFRRQSCGEHVRHSSIRVQAPSGRHTAFMWEKLPYRLNGDAHNWDTAREEHGRMMLGLWQKHAPNLASRVG